MTMLLVHIYTHDGKDFTNRKHHHVESVLCWSGLTTSFAADYVRSALLRIFSVAGRCVRMVRS